MGLSVIFTVLRRGARPAYLVSRKTSGEIIPQQNRICLRPSKGSFRSKGRTYVLTRRELLPPPAEAAGPTVDTPWSAAVSVSTPAVQMCKAQFPNCSCACRAQGWVTWERADDLLTASASQQPTAATGASCEASLLPHRHASWIFGKPTC
jgi:hypothetical protein